MRENGIFIMQKMFGVRYNLKFFLQKHKKGLKNF